MAHCLLLRVHMTLPRQLANLGVTSFSTVIAGVVATLAACSASPGDSEQSGEKADSAFFDTAPATIDELKQRVTSLIEAGNIDALESALVPHKDQGEGSFDRFILSIGGERYVVTKFADKGVPSVAPEDLHRALALQPSTRKFPPLYVEWNRTTVTEVVAVTWPLGMEQWLESAVARKQTRVIEDSLIGGGDETRLELATETYKLTKFRGLCALCDQFVDAELGRTDDHKGVFQWNGFLDDADNVVIDVEYFPEGDPDFVPRDEPVDPNVAPGEHTDPWRSWERFLERQFADMGEAATIDFVAQHEISIDEVPEGIREEMEDRVPEWAKETGPAKIARAPIDGRFFYLELFDPPASDETFYMQTYHPADFDFDIIFGHLIFE
jgi:hypothetical protein